MRISSYQITRFQFARDRVIGDSQVRADEVNVAALELIDDTGNAGWASCSSCSTRSRRWTRSSAFRGEAWPGLKGQPPVALAHRVSRPRGGNQRAFTLPFHEAVQVAVWDLAAKQQGLPLHSCSAPAATGSRPTPRPRFPPQRRGFRRSVQAGRRLGYGAFKIKVGHPDFERDLHRLDLVTKAVRPGAQFMIDANEAWGAKEAIVKLEAIRRAGYELLWVEDPILRNDFDGLRLLREGVPWTLINSGEYLDAAGKRQLMQAGGTDIFNVHGQVTDVMRIGWLAAELGIPVSLGNTFLEVGVHMACALPEVEWLEYSFQNFEHLVESTDGNPRRLDPRARPAGPRAGAVRNRAPDWARPKILSRDELGDPPSTRQAALPS